MPIKRVALLIITVIVLSLPCASIAENLSGTTYQVKQTVLASGGFSSSSVTYQLQYLLGANSMQAMSGSVYGMKMGFYAMLNSAPVASVNSYNDGDVIQDDTPTLTWIYSDSDNDTQTRFQIQVARDNFASVVLDSGAVDSSGVSYTTTSLPYTSERIGYKWRVRVHDGTTWSGWTQADNGFILTSAGEVITELAALTSPSGASIAPDTWQEDNDPYFYWDITTEGLDIIGFSYALDALPFEQVLTNNKYYYYSENSLTDGAHSFYVIAQRSSGIWEGPAAFNIWVDTAAPSISSIAPSSAGVLSTDLPQISAILNDNASGIDPNTIELRINQSQVTPAYNAATGAVSYVPTTPLSEGEISVSLSVRDLVGNYGFPLVWSFSVDTEGPSGTIMVNNGDEMTTSTIVTLNLTSEDDNSEVEQMMISNDNIFDTETWETFSTLRRNWVLPAINGERQVYAQFKDEAGNVSEVVSDKINLVIIASDTYILSGPSGMVEVSDAQFSFDASLSDCQFSYKFDNEEWSAWSAAITVQKSGFADGNHYFMVRSAKDLNQDGLLQLDEVDPTPALRVWTISSSGLLKPKLIPEKPVKRWEED